MTGREIFELLREAKISFEFDPKDNSFYGLKGDIKIGLSDLAAFIDNYFLPRPLFEDGTPVKVGDRVLLYGIADREVTDYCVCDDGSFAINNFQYDQDQRLKKPEQPDSWEQIEADEKKSGAEYWGCEGEDEHPCFGCEHSFMKTGKTCTMNKYVDIFRRAKALAVEWEEVKDE